MLPAVLLHVIGAALPVDLRADFAGRDWGVEDMGHALFLIDHLDDVRAAQRSRPNGSRRKRDKTRCGPDMRAGRRR
jgi:hypothetical protein